MRMTWKRHNSADKQKLLTEEYLVDREFQVIFLFDFADNHPYHENT